MTKLFIIYFIFLATSCESARILAVFPSQAQSHLSVFRAVINGLIDRGHDVVMITNMPEESKEIRQNLKEISLNSFSQPLVEIYNVTEGFGKRSEKKKVFKDGMAMYNSCAKLNFNSHVIQDLIHSNERFDLIILEIFYRHSIMFAHAFKAPVVMISSFYPYGYLDIMGSPKHPLLYPSIYHPSLKDLPVEDQIRELSNELYIVNGLIENEQVEDALMKSVFPDIPSIREQWNKIDMFVQNMHPLWGGIRPVPFSVVQVAGLHQKPEKPLPDALQSYLDSSKNGVIYVSFGTNVDRTSLTGEQLKLFVNVFSDLPYEVLWKWDNIEGLGNTTNIKTGTWWPQADLLRHPNIKLFITQAGLQSTDEAITAGVPLLGIPMLFDQWCNADTYVRHNIGLKLEFDTLIEDSLRNAIDTVIRNKSYRENIVKLRKLMYDQPQTSLERVLWGIEHVLRHGNARHMRSPSTNITWTEYLELELLLIMLTLLFLIVTILVYVAFKVYRRILMNK